MPSYSLQFQENYPFISCIKSNDIEYIGILINLDDNVASIYDISAIKIDQERNFFLEMGETWWWESNRKIPINLFLSKEFAKFKPYLKTFAKKETTIVEGPVVNLLDLINRKLKKRTIQLVRSGE